MDNTNFKRLLKSQGLKATTPRLKIFEIFKRQDCAVTYSDIERCMAEHMDRVTLYRTLKTFEERGFIHRITGTDGSANFALTPIDWNELCDGSAEQHIHFSCMRCKNIYCLDSPAMPEVTLPDEYKVEALNIIISGICDRCNK